MKIAIFSDCHCGFKFGEERGEDSFKSLEEAIELSRDADLILLAGDVFDTRIPRLEIISRTAKILNKTKFYKSNAKLIYSDKQINHHILGTPIIAIHGTHERRTKELINPIQMLEDTGQLIYLHNSTVIFDINGKKVAIHGMSGVPERYAKSVLMSWNPKPIENAINIFMFHQSIEPYIYSPLEPPTLKPEDLPDGFDLYVLGHLHWHDEK
ncbi:MAG: DNA repair exonuclease, partial [Candidatus Pacearchaeota archaeon]